MAVTTAGYYLPLEIVLNVIDQTLPKDPVPLALPASHLVTKTLLSLTLTSRAIHSIAVRYLYDHCLYIESSQRLNSLLDGLTHRWILGPPKVIPAETATFMKSITRLQQPVFRPTSLFLALFSDNCGIIDRKVVEKIDQLFRFLAPTLTQLVVDIPFRVTAEEENAEEENSLRSILRASFERLVHLQVYCDVQSELYLETNSDVPEDSYTNPVWKAWPALRILALYNPDVEYPEFWGHLAERAKLETVVFTRAEGISTTDLTKEWRTQVLRLNPDSEPRLLKFVAVNVEADHALEGDYHKDLRWLIPRQIEVPTSYYGDEDERILCQDWVKRLMLKGVSVDEWG